MIKPSEEGVRHPTADAPSVGVFTKMPQPVCAWAELRRAVLRHQVDQRHKDVDAMRSAVLVVEEVAPVIVPLLIRVR